MRSPWQGRPGLHGKHCLRRNWQIWLCDTGGGETTGSGDTGGGETAGGGDTGGGETTGGGDTGGGTTDPGTGGGETSGGDTSVPVDPEA